MKQKMAEKIITGIDIGGTHISVCLADISKGILLNETISRQHIDPSLGPAEIIKQWCDAIRISHDKAGLPIQQLGIAMPGPFDYENGISFIKGLNKYDQLYGLNVKELIAAELSNHPSDIRMINDASAFLMGEINGGAGKGLDNVVGITLGTGLGSASFYNALLHEGDLWCMPFRDSRAEDYACSRWLVDNYRKRTGKFIDGVKEIAGQTDQDLQAKLLFIEFGTTLAEVLIRRYREQDPKAIIIGGNIAKAWTNFIQSARSEINRHGFNWELLPSQLGEAAALFGAACLWKDDN